MGRIDTCLLAKDFTGRNEGGHRGRVGEQGRGEKLR